MQHHLEGQGRPQALARHLPVLELNPLRLEHRPGQLVAGRQVVPVVLGRERPLVGALVELAELGQPTLKLHHALPADDSSDTRFVPRDYFTTRQPFTQTTCRSV